MVQLVETLADGTELMNRETIAEYIHSYVADVVNDVIVCNPDKPVAFDNNNILATIGMLVLGSVGATLMLDMLYTMLLDAKPAQMCEMYSSVFGRDVTTKDGEYFYISPMEKPSA